MEPAVKKMLLVLLGLVLVLVASIAAFLLADTWDYLEDRATVLERLVTVSWGNGKYGDAYYGAYVHYEPSLNNTVEVKLTVRIGRGNAWVRYEHDERTIGTARDPVDAVARYGVVSWSEEGIRVGSAPGKGYLFPRAEMERHR